MVQTAAVHNLTGERAWKLLDLGDKVVFMFMFTESMWPLTAKFRIFKNWGSVERLRCRHQEILGMSSYSILDLWHWDPWFPLGWPTAPGCLGLPQGEYLESSAWETLQSEANRGLVTLFLIRKMMVIITSSKGCSADGWISKASSTLEKYRFPEWKLFSSL